MPKHGPQRKLTAIFAADVAGYSRLMGADEAGTLRRLKRHLDGLIGPLIAEHGGRIVKLMGDGLLAEFQSVVEAVACAVDIQKALAASEAALPESERMLLRIGVNLGDVIAEGADIHGDGVNIAARLQQLAEPGGICISASAYQQVKGKLDIALVAQGPQRLKNISERMENRPSISRGSGAILVSPTLSRAACGWPRNRSASRPASSTCATPARCGRRPMTARLRPRASSPCRTRWPTRSPRRSPRRPVERSSPSSNRRASARRRRNCLPTSASSRRWHGFATMTGSTRRSATACGKQSAGNRNTPTRGQ